jgi:putative addiction module component (TIGR02574 family)
MNVRTIDISALTIADRLELIDRLWASIDAEREESPELIAELRHRLEAHERDPSSALPMDVAFARLRRRSA